MEFVGLDACFCPLLSIGQEQAVACHKQCAWYNPVAEMCDINVVGNRIVHDPDLMEVVKQNINPSQAE